MMRIAIVLASLLTMHLNCHGQTATHQKKTVLPADYDTLNYRLVGFAVPENKTADIYQLQLQEYFPQDGGGVDTRPVFVKNHPGNKFIELAPSFGRNYMWRVVYMRQKKAIDSTAYSHFSTGYSPMADDAKYRARIIESRINNPYLHVFEDATRVLYDAKGNAVWYLPDIPGIVNSTTSIRDIKLTPFNTITFLTLDDAVEIDYNGRVLWRAPNDGKVSGDSSEHYHHEFTRLHNGNYMVCGIKTVAREIPADIAIKGDEGRMIRRETRENGERFFTANGKKYENVQFGTLIEYDRQGNIAWYWNSGDNFTDDDIFRFFTDSSLRSRTHLNAFYFNEKNNTIYTSYRNISRVMKIDYPSGRLLANYGEAIAGRADIPGNGMFYGQHSCKVSRDGQLYVFNNNSSLKDTSLKKASTVVFMAEPKKPGERLVKTWEYSCDIDTLASGFTAGGGSVNELQDGSVLVCMASSRSFVVSKSKEVLWNMLIEVRSAGGTWELIGNGYRNSPVETGKQLNGLIFSDLRSQPGRD